MQPRVPASASWTAAIFALALTAAPASAQSLEIKEPTPPPPLTEFQWALQSEGGLLLVPVDGRLYPAKRDGAGVIETMPLQLSIALHGAQEDEETPDAVALSDVRSPFEIAPHEWILQRRTEEGWIAAASFHFYDGAFYALFEPGSFERVAPATYRFISR